MATRRRGQARDDDIYGYIQHPPVSRTDLTDPAVERLSPLQSLLPEEMLRACQCGRSGIMYVRWQADSLDSCIRAQIRLAHVLSRLHRAVALAVQARIARPWLGHVVHLTSTELVVHDLQS